MNSRPIFRGAPYRGDPRNELERLRAEHASMSQRIVELTRGQATFGIIVGLDGDIATVSTAGGNIAEMSAPQGIDLDFGSCVRIRNDQNGQGAIVDLAALPEGGNVVQVERVVDGQRFEASVRQQKVLIFHPKWMTVKEGDHVLLDPLSGIAATKNLGHPGSEHELKIETGVRWDDIGGQAEAKAALIDALVSPVQHADLWKKYKRRASRGALLFGPAGCGKTLLAAAAATAVAEVYGKRHVASGYLYVKGPSLFNKWVGETEANVRACFAKAKAHKKAHGYPCTFFLDEADAVVGVRGSNPGNEGMERTIVPMFLAELDGFEDSGCFFLLATNRPDRLDPAIVRDGRVDRKIQVGRPTKDDALAIVDRALSGRPHAHGCAETCVDEVLSDRHKLYHLETHLPGNEGVNYHLPLLYGDLITGARLVGLVERATSYAMAREIDGGDRGIFPADFVKAVGDAVREERGLDHSADILEWAERQKRVIEKVRRV